MDSRLQNQTKNHAQLHSAQRQAEVLGSSPFTASVEESESQQLSVQAQLERAARFGHDFSKVKVGGDAPAMLQQKVIQPKEEPEEQEADFTAEPIKLMAPPVNPHPIQRQEEFAQTKPLAGLFAPFVQRLPEEEIAQTKPISPLFTGVVQRQEEERDEQKQPVQFKLVVGAPGDKYEQEADDIAAKVMGMPDSAIQQKIQRREEDLEPEIQKSPLADAITPLVQRQAEEEIQTKSAGGEFQAGNSIESRLASQQGKGSPLDEGVRAFIEPRLGVDLSSVRVHTDSDAVQLNKELGAQAFAHGSDIYFNQGKYNPGTSAGKELITHEVVHTVQQTGGKKLQTKALAREHSDWANPSVRAKHKETLQAKISPIADAAIQCKKAPDSPESDPAFQAVIHKTNSAASQQKAHPPAKVKSAEAQAAAQPPANEVESKAQDKQVQEMNLQQPGKFNAAAFKAALMQKIAAITPKTLEEADEFKENNKIESVKGEVSSQVTEEKKQASNPIEEKTKEPPDSSGIAPKPVTPLPPKQVGTKPGDVGAFGAAPKPKDASEVSLQENSQQLDRQLAEAKLTEGQLQSSNQPEFQSALTAKKTAQADAVKAPQVYRKEEQATLTQAQTQAQREALSQLQGMHGSRSQLLTQVAGLQVDTKGQDEQKRADVANHIEAIYNNTKQKVEASLAQLDTEVNNQFDQGANTAKIQFENYVDQRMERYKDERYSGGLGWGKWVKDKMMGMPSEVNAFYQEGRKLYLASMDKTIDKIANLVATKLNAAKAEIAKGRQEIKKYVAGLEPSLRQVGKEAAQNIENKFDELEQSVDNKQNELVDSLAQKYNEKLQQIDASIEEMKAANRGLVDKAMDAIAGVVKTVLELKNLLMGVLAKAAGAIDKIILDPIGFLGNLVAGLKQGFQNFAGNIWEHLKKGLIGWLTGALAGAGIQIPENFDLKGIFTLVMQVLGMAYEAIRPRLVNILGEKVVSGLEKSFQMVQILATEGVAGLWQFIQDKIGDLKTMVLDNLQNFVIDSVIKAGVMWVLSLLNPASAFVKACKAIYDIVMFFIERGSQIAELVNAVMDSVSAIASGAVGGAAKLVENALSKALPVVISFMASLLGLGGISEKIQAIIHKVKQPIDKAIDWVISQAVKAAKKLGNKLGFGKGEKAKDKKNGKDGKLEDSEIGKTINFSAEGHKHRLWIKAQGTSVTVIVASVPGPVEAKLDEWQGRLNSLPEEKRPQAQSLLGTARDRLGLTQGEAQETAQEMQQASQNPTNEAVADAKQADDRAEAAEQSLADVLERLFELFGDENTLNPCDIYKARVEKMIQETNSLSSRVKELKDANEKITGWNDPEKDVKDLLHKLTRLSTSIDSLKARNEKLSPNTSASLEKGIKNYEEELDLYTSHLKDTYGVVTFTPEQKDAALHKALQTVANQLFPIDDVKKGEPTEGSAANQDVNPELKSIASIILSVQSKYEKAANGDNDQIFNFQGTNYYVCGRSKYIIPAQPLELLEKQGKIKNKEQREEEAEKLAKNYRYEDLTVGEINQKSISAFSQMLDYSKVKINANQTIVKFLAIYAAEPVRNNLANVINLAMLRKMDLEENALEKQKNQRIVDVHPMARGGGTNETESREKGGKPGKGTWKLEVERAREIISEAEKDIILKAKNIDELTRAYENALRQAILQHRFYWAARD